MATRIKSNQIENNTIVAADLHSAIAINTTAAGTFGSVVVDTITIDQAAISTTSNMTLDSGSDIILDADGGNIMLKDATVWFGNFNHNGNNLAIDAKIVDGDIKFRGTKSGSPNVAVDALILDMSNDGRATFNENVVVAGTITGVTDFNSSGDMNVGGDLQINGNTTLGNAGTDTVTIPGVLSVTNTTQSTSTSTGSLKILGGAGIAKNLNVGGNIVVTGDLTVEGTQTTLNTTALDVEDKNITLNYHASNDTSSTANGAGITIQDAVDASNDASILWDTSGDKFNFSHAVRVQGADIANRTTTTATPVLSLFRDVTDSSHTSTKDSAVDFLLSRQQTVNNNYPYTRLDIRLAGGTDSSTPSLDVMSLLHNGNVGIGDFSSTAPATKLHVLGTSSSRNTIVSTATLDGGTTVAHPYENFGFGVDFIGRDYGNAIRNYAGIYTIMEHKVSSSGGGDAGFKTALSFHTNSGGASGTDPTEKVRISNLGNMHLNTGVDARVQLGTSGTGTNSISDNSVYVRGNDDDLILGAAGNGSIFFKENANVRMVIKPSGNVGIGPITSSNPIARLHVQDNSNVEYDDTDYQHDIFVEKRNNDGDNQFGGLRFAVTGHNGSTTAEGSIGLVQTDNHHAGELVFGTRNSSGVRAEKMRITSGGDVEVRNGGMLRAYRAGNSAYAGLFLDSGEKLYIRNSWATKDIVMLRTGEVGIGNNSPVEQLDVSGTALVDNAKLRVISKTKTDTAVAVFVYDTRKDSDGGAWRKRTQHTSWYNETLNTSTRGARKEFPSVAVITVENQKLRIYDGDDPDMPMWMVFDVQAEDMLGGANPSGGAWLSGVEAVNGNISVSSESGYAPYIFNVNFISEIGNMWHYSDGKYRYKGNISTRNDADGFYVEDSSASIVYLYCRDVATTVLPNAPIDSATGLPVPTIAVATDNGISVIKDNGTIVDITVGSSSYAKIAKVDISPDGFLAWRHIDTRSAKAAPIPEVDKSYGFWTYGQDANNNAYNYYESHAYADNLGNIPALVSVGGGLKDHIVGKVVSGSDGLTMIGLQKNDSKNRVYGDADMPLTAYVTKDYNTGWMMTKIALATLSDTDDTNVTDAELVTNGTFASNISGWTALRSAVLSHSSGAINITNASGVTSGMASQAVTVQIGKTYVYEFTRVSGSNNAYARVGTTATGGFYFSNVISSGTFSRSFTATTTTAYISLQVHGGSDGDNVVYDNVSLRLAEADRSWHENGVKAFGTVTKTAVATGAELVGYSGFSTSNYLQQTYNSDLDFGTGDFSIAVWLKPVASTTVQLIVHRRKLDGTGAAVEFGLNSDETPYLYTGGGSTPITGKPLPVGEWVHVVAVRNSDGFYGIYVNGKLFNSSINQNVNNIVQADAHTLIGGYITNGSRTYPWQGSMALLRVSGTAPSIEQIEKMYNDEKHLFATNAKATIYGSSTNPLAIAYDDDTESLHVGTSAGRSVFQGLNRVDNTTDAVGVAISASNGIVAEE